MGYEIYIFIPVVLLFGWYKFFDGNVSIRNGATILFCNGPKK